MQEYFPFCMLIVTFLLCRFAFSNGQIPLLPPLEKGDLGGFLYADRSFSNTAMLFNLSAPSAQKHRT